jgi:hypothetical protein
MTQKTNGRAGHTADRQNAGDRKEPALTTKSGFHPQWMSVYAGQLCIGHVMHRGRGSFEAFDRDDGSLGTFPTVQEAAGAVSKAVAS